MNEDNTEKVTESAEGAKPRQDDLTEEQKEWQKMKANDRYATMKSAGDDFRYCDLQRYKASDRAALIQVYKQELDGSLVESEGNFDYDVWDPKEPAKGRWLQSDYFPEVRKKNPRTQMLTTYTSEAISHYKMKLYKVKDLDAGFALKPNEDGDGYDIVSVFNNSEKRNVADSLIKDAIAHGGVTIDYFDGFLHEKLSVFGFETVKSEPWSEEFKPEGWSYEPVELKNSSYRELWEKHKDNPLDTP